MNWGIEWVLKYKFENLSGPENFPQWSSPPLAVIFSTSKLVFSFFFHGRTLRSMWQDCNSGKGWWEVAQEKTGEWPRPHNLLLQEWAACQPTCLHPGHCTLSSPFALFFVLAAPEQCFPRWWVRAGACCGSRRSVPIPLSCCRSRTFFPPCCLLTAPQGFDKRRKTWEFEMNI